MSTLLGFFLKQKELWEITYNWNKGENNHYTGVSQFGVSPRVIRHCLEIFLVITTQGPAAGI